MSVSLILIVLYEIWINEKNKADILSLYALLKPPEIKIVYDKCDVYLDNLLIDGGIINAAEAAINNDPVTSGAGAELEANNQNSQYQAKIRSSREQFNFAQGKFLPTTAIHRQNSQESEEEKEEREFQMFIRKQKRKRNEMGSRAVSGGGAKSNEPIFFG